MDNFLRRFGLMNVPCSFTAANGSNFPSHQLVRFISVGEGMAFLIAILSSIRAMTSAGETLRMQMWSCGH
jgi:hypothetical protein